MFVFLTVLGTLLFAFGAMTMITAIPYTSWDASWAEIKEAFHIMFRKRRFQVGSICFIVGFLVMMGLLLPYI